MVDPTTFRDVMAQWPSGVTVVTTLTAEGERRGITASSFSSVSLEPPLVSICLDKKLYTNTLIRDSGVFGISVLAKDQQEVARRFAGMVKDCPDRFIDETWTTAETGVSLLDSALGWLDCRIAHEYDGGDHTIFVGRVVAAHAARRSAPLLFHSRGWGQFADVLPDLATLADTGIARHLAGTRPDALAALAVAGVRVRIADLSTQSLPEVLAAAPPSLDLGTTTALVADRQTALRALEAGIGAVEVVAERADAAGLAAVLEILDGVADRARVHVTNGFEATRREEILVAVETLAKAGVAEISLPDTGGLATPLEVRSLLQEAVPLARPTALRMGLDDRDRLGLVKGLTALKSGVRDFDTTLGGPAGQVATEDLIRLLDTLDVSTAVDAEAVTGIAASLDGLGASYRTATITDPKVPAPASVPNSDPVGAAG